MIQKATDKIMFRAAKKAASRKVMLFDSSALLSRNHRITSTIKDVITFTRSEQVVYKTFSSTHTGSSVPMLISSDTDIFEFSDILFSIANSDFGLIEGPDGRILLASCAAMEIAFIESKGPHANILRNLLQSNNLLILDYACEQSRHLS